MSNDLVTCVPVEYWVSRWIEEAPVETCTEEAVLGWFRTMVHDHCLDLIVRFPPLCVVRCKPEHLRRIPSPGTQGFVYSYVENCSNAWVTVAQCPESEIRGEICDPDTVLEVTGYKKPFTPEYTQRLIEHVKAERKYSNERLS